MVVGKIQKARAVLPETTPVTLPLDYDQLTDLLIATLDCNFAGISEVVIENTDKIESFITMLEEVKRHVTISAFKSRLTKTT